METMKHWPVPKSYSKIIPKQKCQGSFWEDRDDRHHCGIDIYAPFESEVVSVYKGLVIETGIFTNKSSLQYWNETKYVIIENEDGFFCVYAEMKDIEIKVKQPVKAGQLIGHVGLVLNKDKITDMSPPYIQRIKNKGNLSMLHFEVHKTKPVKNSNYLGGNWFARNRPEGLIDPKSYLKNIFYD
jgi:murein DD-endopeptidase MepM/ murein hydrolase activator NlpD